MEYKKLNLVVFSPTRTSCRVAEYVAEGMEIAETELLDLTCREMPERILEADTVALFAVPVYGGRVAETALERLKRITGSQTPAVIIVVYGNRDYEDALLKSKDFVAGQGFIPVAGAAFIGEHSYSRPAMPIAAGRPDEQDREQAKEFGQMVRKKLKPVRLSAGFPVLQVKGNFPYKVKGPKTPATPVTLPGHCIQCGVCMDVCPVAAIVLQPQAESDASLCMKCCACVKQCPTQARVFDTPYTEMLFTRYSTRREPEFFI